MTDYRTSLELQQLLKTLSPSDMKLYQHLLELYSPSELIKAHKIKKKLSDIDGIDKVSAQYRYWRALEMNPKETMEIDGKEIPVWQESEGFLPGWSLDKARVTAHIHRKTIEAALKIQKHHDPDFQMTILRYFPDIP